MATDFVTASDRGSVGYGNANTIMLMNSITQVEKGPIEYRVVGKGSTGSAVLVLNGGHTNCRSPFGHEQFFLEEGYQLIIPSRPGYGKTPSCTGRTAEAFADAIVCLLDHLHFELGLPRFE